MMKRILILVICLLCAVAFCSCDDSDEGIDGSYTAVTDDSGNITGYERVYHDDHGNVTRWDVYDSQEEYDHYLIYEYDSQNRLAKETYYDANGFGIYYFAYLYNENGKLAEKDYVTAKNGSERLLYDSEGKESERMSYDASNNLIKYEVYRDGEWVTEDPPTEAEETTAEE